MIARRNLIVEGLRLEPVEPAHAERTWAATEVSLDALLPWMAWAPGASLDTTREFAAEASAEWGRHSFTFVIFEGDEVAGGMGLNHYNPLFESAELGYWTRTDLAGRGVATTAGRAVLDFGFGDVGLHRVQLQAAPENLGSVRVATKLGFTRVGRFRDGARGVHGFHDVDVFDLLADEWRRSRSR